MKVSAAQNGLTVRVIAGTHCVILAMDMVDALRQNCLGFSIYKTVLGPKGAPYSAAQQVSWYFPSLLSFKDAPPAPPGGYTTETQPLQEFRWSDWGANPAMSYRYTVIARGGTWNQLTSLATVAVEVTTEDTANPATSVFFNRAAAASKAFNDHFKNMNVDLDKEPIDPAVAQWLSHGLEEGLIAYLRQAVDKTYALHAAIYEFQKDDLLQELTAALGRGVQVQVVYHYRDKNNLDKDAKENEAAAAKNGLSAVCIQRSAGPQGAIMHNKFVVLLQNGVPQAVWTGSTNWTDGGLYGQFNLGHAVYDPAVAKAYDDYWNVLSKDPQHDVLKQAVAQLTPVPADVTQVKPGFTPILSPDSDVKMLNLYGKLCNQADMLLVCAPFELANEIRSYFHGTAPGKLDLLLLDKAGSLGNDVGLVERDPDNEVVIATTRSDGGLHDLQNRLLESGESFHHQGIHIHAKIIACDPLGPDPIIVFGSANFSNGSTVINDENSVISRGDSALADVYVTEFMRVFDTYKSRYKTENAQDAQAGLSEDASWSAPYYVPGSTEALNRQFFAGTM